MVQKPHDVDWKFLRLNFGMSDDDSSSRTLLDERLQLHDDGELENICREVGDAVWVAKTWAAIKNADIVTKMFR